MSCLKSISAKVNDTKLMNHRSSSTIEISSDFLFFLGLWLIWISDPSYTSDLTALLLKPFSPYRTIRHWSDASLHFLSRFLWPSHTLCNSSIYSIRFQSLKAVQSDNFWSPFWLSTLNYSQCEVPFDRPHSISEGLKSFLIPKTLSPFWSSNFRTYTPSCVFLVMWREMIIFNPWLNQKRFAFDRDMV
jgi:hypothetical protein